MQKVAKIAQLAIACSLVAIALTLFSNRSLMATARAGSVANAPAPIAVRVEDVDSPGRHAFAVSATCSNVNDTGCAANPVLPSTTSTGAAVKTVVIDFVSGFCTGLASGITQDNFNFGYALNSQPNAVFFPATVDLGGTGRIGLQTTIYADPGVTTSFGAPGNSSGCTFSLTGHLIPL